MSRTDRPAKRSSPWAPRRFTSMITGVEAVSRASLKTDIARPRYAAPGSVDRLDARASEPTRLVARPGAHIDPHDPLVARELPIPPAAGRGDAAGEKERAGQLPGDGRRHLRRYRPAGAPHPAVVGRGVEEERIDARALVGAGEAEVDAALASDVEDLHDRDAAAAKRRLQLLDDRGQLIGVQLHPPRADLPHDACEGRPVARECDDHRLDRVLARDGRESRELGDG